MKRFRFASGDHKGARCFVTLPTKLYNKRGIVPENREKKDKTSVDLFNYSQGPMISSMRKMKTELCNSVIIVGLSEHHSQFYMNKLLLLYISLF